MNTYWRVHYRGTGGEKLFVAQFPALQTKEQLFQRLKEEAPDWRIVSIVHVTDAERQKTASSDD